MAQSFSFKKGWNQLKVGDTLKVRQKIMEALGLNVPSSFYYRLNGRCEPTISEAKAIEAVFKEYGITKVWGDA